MVRLEKGDKVRVHKDPCYRIVSIVVFDPLVSASVVVHLKAGPQLNCSFRGGKLYQDDVRDGAGVVGRERQVKVIPQDNRYRSSPGMFLMVNLRNFYS